MERKDHRIWIRRHPFATILCLLDLVLLVAFIAWPGDTNRASVAVGWFVFFGIPVALGVWLVTALIDRRARKQRAISSSGATVEAPGTPQTALLPPSPGAFPPSDQSAFEETAHQPLPESPTIQQFRLVTLGDFLEMTPTEFEQLCVRELSAIGFREVRRTGGAGDLAADIVATDIQGRSCIVQCKRYAPGSNVGSPTVQMFIGMKAVHHKADRGIIMTTAEFSRPAVDLAKQHDIVLIDGDDMVKIVNLLGKGSGRSVQPTSPMSSAAAMEPSVRYSSAGVGGGGANPPSPLRPTAQAITCPRCGATNLPTSIRFCSNCGLQRTEPPTGTPAVLETARGDHCPRCGRRNRTGEWFCRHCGFQLRR